MTQVTFAKIAVNTLDIHSTGKTLIKKLKNLKAKASAIRCGSRCESTCVEALLQLKLWTVQGEAFYIQHQGLQNNCSKFASRICSVMYFVQHC